MEDSSWKTKGSRGRDAVSDLRVNIFFLSKRLLLLRRSFLESQTLISGRLVFPPARRGQPKETTRSSRGGYTRSQNMLIIIAGWKVAIHHHLHSWVGEEWTDHEETKRLRPAAACCIAMRQNGADWNRLFYRIWLNRQLLDRFVINDATHEWASHEQMAHKATGRLSAVFMARH